MGEAGHFFPIAAMTISTIARAKSTVSRVMVLPQSVQPLSDAPRPHGPYRHTLQGYFLPATLSLSQLRRASCKTFLRPCQCTSRSNNVFCGGLFCKFSSYHPIEWTTLKPFNFSLSDFGIVVYRWLWRFHHPRSAQKRRLVQVVILNKVLRFVRVMSG